MHIPKSLLSLLILVLLTGASAAQLRQVAVVDIPGRPGFDSIAWAKGHLVIAHGANDTVDVFDPVKRRVVAQLNDMSDPRGIAVDEANGRVYVANAGANSIAVISTADWKVVDTIRMAESPANLLLVPELGILFVGNWQAQSISALKLGGAPIGTVDIGGRPEHMVFDLATKLVFVNVQDTAEVVALDTSNRIAKRHKLHASQPTGLAFDERGRRLFVAVRYAVLVLDPESGQELARVPSPPGVDDLWFDQEKGTLYAASSGGTVSMISLDGGRHQTEHELQTKVRGHSLAVDPAKKMVYMPGGFEGRSKLVILKRVETPGAESNQPTVARDPEPPPLPRYFPSLPKPEAKPADPTPETAKAQQ